MTVDLGSARKGETHVDAVCVQECSLVHEREAEIKVGVGKDPRRGLNDNLELREVPSAHDEGDEEKEQPGCSDGDEGPIDF